MSDSPPWETAVRSCDCWLCRYSIDDGFDANDCPHPHFAHRGDAPRKREYLASDEYKDNMAKLKDLYGE